MGRRPTRNKNLPPNMRARHRGKKTYYFYDHGGKPRREESLGTDFIAAVKRWSEIEQADIPKAISPSVKDLFEAYTRDVIPLKARSTQQENLDQIVLLREFFGDQFLLDDMEPTHVKQYKHWRHKKAVEWYQAKKRPTPPNAGQVRANRDMALLSHAFNYARETGMSHVRRPACARRLAAVSPMRRNRQLAGSVRYADPGMRRGNRPVRALNARARIRSHAAPVEPKWKSCNES